MNQSVFRAILSAAMLLALFLLAGWAAATEGECGLNDFRLSITGNNADSTKRAAHPAIAYNDINREFLVVWESNAAPDGAVEIYGRRFGALRGTAYGPAFRISDMGADDGDARYQARYPAVAWNAAANEYLVVWQGTDNSGGLVAGEWEIFEQRLAGATGAEVGANDFRISDAGGSGDPAFAALHPQAAWNSRDNNYLVVWYGDDNIGSHDGNMEIYYQLLDGAGGETAGNDVPITDLSENAANGLNAGHPAVAYNSTENEFLVVWEGDEPGLAQEIWGRRLSGGTGLPIGTNDFRISDMGQNDADTRFNAFRPRVAWNSAHDRYLVVWAGDDDAGAIPDNTKAIYGQFLTGAGAETGANDFRIMQMTQADGTALRDAFHSALGYDAATDQFCVFWDAPATRPGQSAPEHEIFVQRVGPAGMRAGEREACISDMGPNGDAAWRGEVPAVAADPRYARFLALWQGEDDAAGLADNKFEVFGQYVAGRAANVLPAGYTMDVLLPGATVYDDAATAFMSPVPAGLQGQLYIRTHNADSVVTAANFLSFEAKAPVTVYVAEPVAVTVPAWLGPWSSHVAGLIGSGGGSYRVYARSFPAGPVVLGGNSNESQPAASAMYSVIVGPQDLNAAGSQWVRYR